MKHKAIVYLFKIPSQCQCIDLNHSILTLNWPILKEKLEGSREDGHYSLSCPSPSLVATEARRSSCCSQLVTLTPSRPPTQTRTFILTIMDYICQRLTDLLTWPDNSINWNLLTQFVSLKFSMRVQWEPILDYWRPMASPVDVVEAAEDQYWQGKPSLSTLQAGDSYSRVYHSHAPLTTDHGCSISWKKGLTSHSSRIVNSKLAWYYI